MNIAKIWWIKTRCAVLTVQTKANKYVDLANRKAELFPLQSVSNFSILVLLRIITISCFSILVICYFQVSFNLNEISYVAKKTKNWVPEFSLSGTEQVMQIPAYEGCDTVICHSCTHATCPVAKSPAFNWKTGTEAYSRYQLNVKSRCAFSESVLL